MILSYSYTYAHHSYSATVEVKKIRFKSTVGAESFTDTVSTKAILSEILITFECERSADINLHLFSTTFFLGMLSLPYSLLLTLGRDWDLDLIEAVEKYNKNISAKIFLGPINTQIYSDLDFEPNILKTNRSEREKLIVEADDDSLLKLYQTIGNNFSRGKKRGTRSISIR